MNDAGVQVKQTAAEEIRELVIRLSDEISKVTDEVYTKFEKVMINTPTAANSLSAPEREFPPYFSDLRVHLQKIEGKIQTISSAVRRAEL
jgi:hypothetical protein